MDAAQKLRRRIRLAMAYVLSLVRETCVGGIFSRSQHKLRMGRWREIKNEASSTRNRRSPENKRKSLVQSHRILACIEPRSRTQNTLLKRIYRKWTPVQ